MAVHELAFSFLGGGCQGGACLDHSVALHLIVYEKVKLFQHDFPILYLHQVRERAACSIFSPCLGAFFITVILTAKCCLMRS